MDRVIARHHFNRAIRSFFEEREFIEVETPYLVPSPGTDVYIDPVKADLHFGRSTERRYLHTSPEFAMKRLVGEGYERIFQLCKVFRDGERTEIHSPEFTMLEWYRRGEVETIIEDVEALCRVLLPSEVEVSRRRVKLAGPWTRVSMQDLVETICGIDVLACDDEGTLRDAVESTIGLNPRASETWDDLFFDMWVRFIDPVLAKMGVVFVCDWPQRLAVLAERDPEDPRIASRFELFIGGLEIANGFQELTDEVEQRTRFAEDNKTRSQQKRTSMPMPEGFLAVLMTRKLYVIT